MVILGSAYARAALSLMIVMLAIVAVSNGNCSAATAAAVGTVKEIRSGTLERLERDIWKPMAAGMAISANDRVRSNANGTAILTLNDVGTVLVGPGTEYYLGDPSRGFKSLLKRGYLWVSTKLKPGTTMSIATSSAVAGVRGTKFSVIQDPKGMDVCTCKGEVLVTLKDGKSVSVTSGTYGEISTAGKMGAPAKGKPHLEKIWKDKPARYATCLHCHKKGQKAADLS